MWLRLMQRGFLRLNVFWLLAGLLLVDWQTGLALAGANAFRMIIAAIFADEDLFEWRTRLLGSAEFWQGLSDRLYGVKGTRGIQDFLYILGNHAKVKS